MLYQSATTRTYMTEIAGAGVKHSKNVNWMRVLRMNEPIQSAKMKVTMTSELGGFKIDKSQSH